MVYIATEEDFYSVGLRFLYLNSNHLNPDTALASPLAYLDNMDPMPNQQTTFYPCFLGQDIHDEFQEGDLGTAILEQNIAFDYNPEGYGENDPTLPGLGKSPGLTGETIAHFGTTTSSAESDSTHFIQSPEDGPITLGPPSSEWPQRDLDNIPHPFTGHVYPQLANMHPSETTSLDPDSEEYDGYDSTPLAASPESTGGVTAYGGTTASLLMVDDTQFSQDIDIWACTSPGSKHVLCVQCGKKLYGMKGFRRHFDDVHVDPERCPECDLWIIGQRKLKTHLKRVHP